MPFKKNQINEIERSKAAINSSSPQWFIAKCSSKCGLTCVFVCQITSLTSQPWTVRVYVLLFLCQHMSFYGAGR